VHINQTLEHLLTAKKDSQMAIATTITMLVWEWVIVTLMELIKHVVVALIGINKVL
jgi:hypothetical protein